MEHHIYSAETTLQKVGQKCLESSEMWCLGKDGEDGSTDHVRNKEVVHSQGGEGISYIQ